MSLKQSFLFQDHPFAFLGKTDCNNIIVSFSGGRSSALMAKRMIGDPYWSRKNLRFVFSNTGKEKPQTLDFVYRCDIEFGLGVVWLEARVNPVLGEGTTYTIVDYFSASRNGEPFESVTSKYGIANAAFPHCSRELKRKPINEYAKSVFGNDYVTALGIRADEIKRLKRKPEFVYPLAAWSVTTADVRDFWSNNDFDLQLKDYEGNCDFCWKKSLRKLLTIAKENPEIPNWWHNMEQRYSMLQVPGRQENAGSFWNRNNTPVSDLVKLSQSPFVPATDPDFKPEPSMDTESPCQCFRQEEIDTD